ncbi:MAG TPA: sulfurtransferase, partial [Burkholderiales bacterium]|nr:sulfurtransferase [Burkholderiales bacterium]
MAFRTLISTADLAARLDDPEVRIFDCRHDLTNPDAGNQAYRSEHIA